MNRPVLVPLDGSSFAESALPCGLSLSRKLDVGLQLLSVEPAAPRFGLNRPSEELEEWRRGYLEGTADEVEEVSGIRPSVRLAKGVVWEEIAAHCKEHEVGLVVMATHGRGPFSRFWLGSVADALVRNAPVPVLLIRSEDGESPKLDETRTFRHILVALDGSRLSEETLGPAGAVARATGGRLTLLQVVLDPRILITEATPGTVQAMEKLLEERKAAAENHLSGLITLLAGDGLQVESGVVVGEQVARAIVEQAAKRGADLIALSTHGRGGLTRAVLGSVTDKVVRSASVPVLVRRPEGS